MRKSWSQIRNYDCVLLKISRDWQAGIVQTAHASTKYSVLLPALNSNKKHEICRCCLALLEVSPPNVTGFEMLLFLLFLFFSETNYWCWNLSICQVGSKILFSLRIYDGKWHFRAAGIFSYFDTDADSSLSSRSPRNCDHIRDYSRARSVF